MGVVPFWVRGVGVGVGVGPFENWGVGVGVGVGAFSIRLRTPAKTSLAEPNRFFHPLHHSETQRKYCIFLVYLCEHYGNLHNKFYIFVNSKIIWTEWHAQILAMPNSFLIMSKMKSKMEKLRGMRHIYNYIYNTQIITAEKAAGENPRRGPLLGFSPILTVWAKIAGGGGSVYRRLGQTQSRKV